ncbi:MAG: sugar phosphate nucleotidyltransferase [Fimbriimonadales bacterium]
MRGIVIAGGFGTRLRPLTLTRPKPLMPLVNAPLLAYQLSYLKAAGIKEVCFATNYMWEAVQAEFGDGTAIGMKIVYAVEDEPLDTGGAIRNAYDAFPGDECVVFNGDVIHGFDIADIVRKHHERGADVTLTLHEVARPHVYGVVPVGEGGEVRGFHEPSDEQKRALSGPADELTDLINAGLYVMSAAAIETIPLRRCNVEREVFPKLIGEGWRVFGDVRGDYWIDIGRPTQYLEAVAAIVSGQVASVTGASAVHGEARVHESAKVCCHSSIGKGVTIGEGSTVCASAIFEDVRVGSGVKIVRSVIGEGSVIGSSASIENSVLAAGSVIGEHSLLGGFA